MKQILKIIIFVILAMNVYCLTAQAALGFSLSLDNKLTFLEDDYGNTPFTFDGTFKFSMQGYQKEFGFTQASAKYEFADLSGGELHRYGVEFGYVFTYTRSNDIGLMPFAGYGILARGSDYARRSWEFGAVASYRVFKRLKIITSIVWTERTDLPAVGFRMNMNTGLQFDISTNYLNL
jgi:hypothetical protein